MYGYSVGHIGQGCAYGFMSTYLVLYLTDCVQMKPGMATLVSSIALFVEVIMGMIVGNRSDSCTSKRGRRIPFMFAAACAMLPIFALLFHKINANPTIEFIYYLFFAMLFRVFFSCFEIPNQALGAEIAFGYDERTKLRTIVRIFSIFGNAIAYLSPLWILMLVKNNVTLAWQIIGLLVGTVTTISWLLTSKINSYKGLVLDPAKVERKKINPIEIVKNYIALFKLRATKILVIYKAGFTCAYALANVASLYYFKYAVGIDEKITSYMFYINIGIFVIMLPLVNKMALKFGKSRQQMLMLGSCGIVGLLVFLIGPKTILGAAIYFAFFAATQTSFWQLSSAIFYDIIEVDEWVNNVRREGDLMSLVSVLGTFISAIMVELFGVFLESTTYSSKLLVQDLEVQNFFTLIFILIPASCFIICAISLYACPINKKRFESLQTAIKLRKEGKDYSMYQDDIDKIIGK